MTEPQTFTTFVCGDPRPQQRPRARMLPGGRKAAIYVPKCVWRRALRRQLQADVVTQRFEPLVGACAVRLTLHLPRRKYHFGTGRNARRLKPDAPAWPIAAQNGDVDNYAKAVLDAANGILYSDDVQVVELVVRKAYGEEPGVLIECRPVEGRPEANTF